jgi:hypothetical protein
MESISPLLTGSHLRTYKTIFQHPISHNLGWHDVHAMFRKLGQVEEEANGNLKVTRNGQSLVLHPASAKNVENAEAVMELRHFLQRSEALPPDASESGAVWLLVIDHQQARIFRSEMHGAVPQRIFPHEPEEYFRHAVHSYETSRGKEKPNPSSFFEPIAKVLQAAGKILIFGAGTGASSEMEQFVAWTKQHHPELARRIIGSVTVDEHHLSEDQLLAKAREFHASAPHENSP